MSVVVWDGKTLAADRQATRGTTVRTSRKIFRYGDLMMAIIGPHTDCHAIMNWVLSGRDPEKFPAMTSKDECPTVWVINRSGMVVMYEDNPYPIAIHDDCFADGSGGKFAMGAMSMGADAVKAVSVAIRHDAYCGCGIDTLTFDD